MGCDPQGDTLGVPLLVQRLPERGVEAGGGVGFTQSMCQCFLSSNGCPELATILNGQGCWGGPRRISGEQPYVKNSSPRGSSQGQETICLTPELLLQYVYSTSPCKVYTVHPRARCTQCNKSQTPLLLCSFGLEKGPPGVTFVQHAATPPQPPPLHRFQDDI